MTVGIVCFHGRTGYNFGSSITRVFAYLLALGYSLFYFVNHATVRLSRILREAAVAYDSHRTGVLTEYVAETGSAWGAEVLEDLDNHIRRFWLVKPKAASLRALLKTTLANPQ